MENANFDEGILEYFPPEADPSRKDKEKFTLSKRPSAGRRK